MDSKETKKQVCCIDTKCNIDYNMTLCSICCKNFCSEHIKEWEDIETNIKSHLCNLCLYEKIDKIINYSVNS